MASSLSAQVGPTTGSRTFKKPDLEMKQFVIDYCAARGVDNPGSLTNQQLMNAYLDALVAQQRETVGTYRGSQQLAALEQTHQQEIAAAKVEVGTGVDV